MVPLAVAVAIAGSIAGEAVTTEGVTGGVDTTAATATSSSGLRSSLLLATNEGEEGSDEVDRSDRPSVSLWSSFVGVTVGIATSAAVVAVGVDAAVDTVLLLFSITDVNGTARSSIALFSEKSSLILVESLSLSSALQLSVSTINVSASSCCCGITVVVISLSTVSL